MGTRQVRIEEDIALRLQEQGGSLSAAANRTLAWALEAIEAVENEPEPVDINGQYDQASRAGNPPLPRVASGSSRRATNARLFAAAARRPTW